MVYLRIIILLLIIPTLTFSQEFGDVAHLKKEDYSKIKGNPYLFKDWVKADIIHLEKENIEGAMIKFDLYDGSIEVKDHDVLLDNSNLVEINGERLMILNDQYYNKIIITRKNNPEAFKNFDVDTIQLTKGIHRDYLRTYGVVFYNGDKVKLVNTYNVDVRESKINSPGKIITKQKFTRNKGYALIIDKEKIKVKLKDKDFYKALGKKDALKKFKKENKLKLKKVNEFVELLKYYESLN